jgi:hypothetical protein
MSITTTEAQKVAKTIDPVFDQHLEKYNFDKYPAADYCRYKTSYSSFSNPNTDIHDSLILKWGHIGKKNFPQHQKQLIKDVEKLWPEFLSFEKRNASADTFQWWRKKLPKTSYITVAYITHLVHHGEPLPIIDQHNFRAMNHLLGSIRSDYTIKKKPSTWDDIAELKLFMVAVLQCLPKRNFGELDRFLMMYGKSIKPRKPRKSRKP